MNEPKPLNSINTILILKHKDTLSTFRYQLNFNLYRSKWILHLNTIPPWPPGHPDTNMPPVASPTLRNLY